MRLSTFRRATSSAKREIELDLTHLAGEQLVVSWYDRRTGAAPAPGNRAQTGTHALYTAAGRPGLGAGAGRCPLWLPAARRCHSAVRSAPAAGRGVNLSNAGLAHRLHKLRNSECEKIMTDHSVVPAQVWREIELSLTALQAIPKCYTDVEVWVDFVHESGMTLRRPAFWDGGRSWKVRFASPLAGGA